MTDEQTLQEIASLLAIYPGVSASAAYRCGQAAVQIRFRCHAFDSLKAISDCAIWTNEHVVIQPSWAHFSNESGENNDLCFTIDISENWEAGALHSHSMLFGIHLTRDLTKRGLLSVNRSDELHEAWNAEPM